MSDQTAILNMLRKNGHRVTPQRVMILGAVQTRGGHLSAEDVYQAIQSDHPYVNRSTVYRTLEMLTKEGLVTVTDLGKGPVYYELHSGEPHHHLVCQNCGKIEVFDDTLLESLHKALERRYKFRARLDHMAIFGLCSKCQAKTSKGSPLGSPRAASPGGPKGQQTPKG